MALTTLAGAVWDRAAQELARLDGVPRSWLLSVIDADGTEREAIESFPVFDRERATQVEWVTRAVNFGKPIARRVAERDAALAGLALTTAVGVMWTRFEYLVVLAADLEGDMGYLAPLEREESGGLALGSRSEWQLKRRVPFERIDRTQLLDPLRTAMRRALRQGLGDAAKHRRRR